MTTQRGSARWEMLGQMITRAIGVFLDSVLMGWRKILLVLAGASAAMAYGFGRYDLFYDLWALGLIWWIALFVVRQIVVGHFGSAAANIGMLWFTLVVFYFLLPLRYRVHENGVVFVGVCLVIALGLHSLVHDLRPHWKSPRASNVFLALEVVGGMGAVVFESFFMETDALGSRLVRSGSRIGFAVETVRSWYVPSVPPGDRRSLILAILGVFPIYLALLERDIAHREAKK